MGNYSNQFLNNIADSVKKSRESMNKVSKGLEAVLGQAFKEADNMTEEDAANFSKFATNEMPNIVEVAKKQANDSIKNVKGN